MLVLSRRVGESVVIGEGDTKVVVRVVAMDKSGQEVRLGFQADRRVAVLREELLGRDVDVDPKVMQERLKQEHLGLE